MQSDDARLQAEQIFTRARSTNLQDYEERARDSRRKIEYLTALSVGCTGATANYTF